jgi:hypothetical protein
LTARQIIFRRVALGVLALGLVLAAFVTGRLAWATRAVQRDLRAVGELAERSLQALDLDEAAVLLRTTRADLEKLGRAARPFLWMTPALGWVPGYGADLQAAPALLQFGSDLTAAAEWMLEPLLSLLGAQGELEGGGLQALQRSRPQLAEALSHARSAERMWEDLDHRELSPTLQEWVPQLDRAVRLVGVGARAGLIMPDVLGTDGRSTLLVLIQNEDELRATGGFVSGVALVTLRDGSIERVDFEDSYAIDDFSQPYPDAPQPLQEIMLSEVWVLRDSNWSPDYPTSARTAIDLYTISREAEIDGVLTVNQAAIRALIDALGPLQVDGHAQPVTGANVIAVARESWGQGQDSEGAASYGNVFMAAVVDAAVNRLQAGVDRATLLRLSSAAAEALDGRQILIYLVEPEAEGLITELGWDGAIRETPGDYWMVVDSNVGYNKVNALVRSEVAYDVDLSSLGRPRAQLTVRHHHPLAARDASCQQQPRYGETYREMMERCYWNYLRVYVPAASRLADATPHAVPASALLSGRASPAQVLVGPPESGRNVFATLLLLRPGETLETRFEYDLPATVLRALDQEFEYALTVQKQPGTHATPVRVRLRLPGGTRIVSSDPLPAARTGSMLEYALTLERDRVVRVVFSGR